MPRFLVRHRQHPKTPPPRTPPRVPSHPPYQPIALAPISTTSTLLHDTLPSRNPLGHALHYASYTPSRYYVPFNRTPRRPRQNSSLPPPHARDYHAHLHLAFDPKSRYQGRDRSTASAAAAHSSSVLSPKPRHPRNQPNSLQHVIKLKASALRHHLAVAHQLGDLTVLKRVVSNHRDTLSRVRRARHTVLVQLHDAATITGLPPPTTAIVPLAQVQVHQNPDSKSPSLPDPNQIAHTLPNNIRVGPIVSPPSTASPVRRVYGATGRHRRSSRASSTASKTSNPTARATSHTGATDHHEHSPLDASHHPDRPSPPGLRSPGDAGAQSLPNQTLHRRGYVAKLSRKSSGTLKRLSSAGSTLIRRLSRGSVSDEPSSSASVAHSFSSTYGITSALDQDMLTRLQLDPALIIAELESEAKRLQTDEQDTLEKLKAAEKVLEQRRDCHDKVMAILDQFYGNLPGWQQDPITQALFVETVDMTDGGLEAERDLVEARHSVSQANAALRDHGFALSALQSIGEQLGMFINGLERLVRTISDGGRHQGQIQELDKSSDVPAFHGDIWTTFRQLEKYLSKCVSCGEMAAECCVDAPRVVQVEKDVRGLQDGFFGESKAVVTMGKMSRKDLMGSLHIAKATVCDCKLAETFVREREKMIAEDVEALEELVERSEEFVMQERMALVELHHPAD